MAENCGVCGNTKATEAHFGEPIPDGDRLCRREQPGWFNRLHEYDCYRLGYERQREVVEAAIEYVRTSRAIAMWAAANFGHLSDHSDERDALSREESIARRSLFAAVKPFEPAPVCPTEVPGRPPAPSTPEEK